MFFNHQADSFINYRILTGYLDSTLLDLDSYKINSKILIIVFLYLLISGNYANLEKTKKFLGSSDLDETLQYNTNFNEIFNEFLTEKLETNIDEIFTASKYANKFMKLPINYEVVAENFDKTIAFDFQVKRKKRFFY